MIQLDIANTKTSNRFRPESIWVNGVEFNIHTSFPYWITFERIIKNPSSYEQFDYLYIHGIPKNKEAGLQELIKFYKNEQSLPRDVGDNSDIEVIDWLLDSEYIYSAFLSQYNIDLIKCELHWFDFLSLFRSLKGHVLNDIMAYRSWTPPKEHKTPKQAQEAENTFNKKNRQRWELAKEKKEPFKMR